MNKKGQEGFVIGIIVFAVIALIWIFWAFNIVAYNEYAYEVEFGHLNPDLKHAGINYVGFGHLERMNNQIQSYNIKVDASTKDRQVVVFDVNLNMRLKESESFQFLKDYKEESTFITYLNNKILERSKTVITRFSAEDMQFKRLEVGQAIYDEVKIMPELHYFEINDVTLSNFDFSDEYDKSLEKNAQIDVERQIILKQNENLALQQKNINSIDVDKYFKYQLIEKWDGKAPLIISDALLVTK